MTSINSESINTQKKIAHLGWYIIVGLLLIIFTLFGIFGFKLFGFIKSQENKAEPAHYVSSSVVKQPLWHQTLSSVGSLVAVNGIEVSSEVQGIITAIHFHSGDTVKKGAVLFSLSSKVEQGQLQSYEAVLAYNKANYNRLLELFKTNATAKDELDQAVSSLKQSQADVAREQQLIDQKTIKAPFAGKLGIRQVDIGQYIQPGTDMVTLQQLDPLFVNFSLPEKDVSNLSIGQKVVVTTDSVLGKQFTGKVTAISSRIDEATRSIDVQATIPNNDDLLIPGSYASISVYMPKPKKVLVVPTTAITYRLYGDSVYLVEHTGKKDKAGKPILRAKLVYVTVGPVFDKHSVIITKGLKPKEEVVKTGQIKLRDKIRIAINNQK
jgi:membrane fusion protein, multidrug efflux system